MDFRVFRDRLSTPLHSMPVLCRQVFESVSVRPHLLIVGLAALTNTQMPAYAHGVGRFEPSTFAPLRPEIQTIDHGAPFRDHVFSGHLTHGPTEMFP
jgi:hypothetical protein